jgi:hypothetical protein
MFELVKSLLSAVNSIPVDDLRRTNRADKIATAGLALFDVYLQAMKIVELGHAIVDELDWLVKRHAYFYETGNERGVLSAARGLEISLIKQGRNINRFIEAGQRCQLVSAIALKDDGYFRKLCGTAGAKLLWLGALVDLAPAQVLEVGQMTPEGRQLVIKASSILRRKRLGAAFRIIEYEMRRAEEIGFSAETSFLEANDPRFFKSKRSIKAVPWDREINALLRQYIDSGLAAARLKIIAVSASSFREEIQKSFKLDGVLYSAETLWKAGGRYEDL